METIFMKKTLLYAGAGLISLAAAVLPASSSKADMIQFGNQSAPGSSIGGTSNVLDANYNIGSGATPGYDSGIDGILDTSINPNDQFFVTYFPLVDGSGDDVAVDFNKSVYPNIGDSYTARLGFEDRIGGGAYAENFVKFDTLTLDNPNGVTDYQYTLSVDTDLDLVRDHFESGLVSEVMATPEQSTERWNQIIVPGYTFVNNEFYGSLTLEAVGVPEPSSMVLIGVGAGVLGFGALRRRKRVPTRSGATGEK
jgi:PEP-CTERM motif